MYQERRQQPGEDKCVHNELPRFNLGHTHSWRVDRGAEGKEEAVLICGWRDVAAHEGVLGESRHEERSKVKQHLERGKTKHAIPIALKEVDRKGLSKTESVQEG